MAATPDTVARHELVGLDAEVTRSTNPDLEGASGTVVAETTNTLDLESEDRIRTVPKEAAQFAFVLSGGDSEASATDEASSAERSSADRRAAKPRDDGDEPRAVVTVDGEKLVARPARRTEQRGDSRWR